MQGYDAVDRVLTISARGQCVRVCLRVSSWPGTHASALGASRRPVLGTALVARSDCAGCRFGRWSGEPLDPFASKPGRASVLWLLVALLVGGVVRALAVGSGFHMDDIAQIAMLEGTYPIERSWWDLFDFVRSPEEVAALKREGSLPWWTSDELRLAAFRPLASAAFAADHAVFGRWSVPYHLHSLAWWVAMTTAAWLVLRRWLEPKWAGFALLLYALDESHAYTVAWIANRNALMATTFALLAFWLHLRWRQEALPHEWTPARIGRLVAAALAVAAGEYAVAALGLILAWEVVEGAGSWRTRVSCSTGIVIVMLGYIAVRAALGYGAGGSAVYVDPFASPLAWLEALSERGPRLAAELVVPQLADRLDVPEWVDDRFTLVGAAGALVVAAGVPPLWRRASMAERRTLSTIVLAVVVSVVPVSASFVSSRLLTIASLPASMFFAWFVLRGWEFVRRPAMPSSETRGRRSWGGVRSPTIGVIGVALLVAHGVVAPWFGLDDILWMHRYNEAHEQRALEMPVPDDVSDATIVLLSATDTNTLLYPPFLRWMRGRELPRHWWVLSLAPQMHAMTRVDSDTLELRLVEGAMMDSELESFFRPPSEPFAPGDAFDLEGMRVDVRAVDDDGRPTVVRYVFERPIDDPRSVFLITGSRGFVRYPMGRLGATMPVPPAPAPVERW